VLTVLKTLRVVLFRDAEAGCWIAQGLEMDINAQGRTEWSAVENFHATLALREELDLKADREPFSRRREAPHKFFEMLNQGEPWTPPHQQPVRQTRAEPAINFILAAA